MSLKNHPEEAGRGLSYLILFIGVASISTAAILIRLCDAPSLVIATYRLGMASLVLVPVEAMRMRRKAGAHRGGEITWCVLSGFFLALHFGLWISSLSYTSVASSVVLVTTNPLFVGLFSFLILKERLGRKTVVGIVMGILGAVVIGWGDFKSGTDPLFGDLLALGGALAASAYLLTGRVARRTIGIHTYVAWTYGSSTVFLFAGVFLVGLPLWPYSAETFGYLALMALIPQLVGHTSLNWSLAHLSAPTVSIAILGEPIGSSVLAWLLLGEIPPATVYLGSGFILSGIVLALREESSATLDVKAD